MQGFRVWTITLITQDYSKQSSAFGFGLFPSFVAFFRQKQSNDYNEKSQTDPAKTQTALSHRTSRQPLF